MSVIRSTRTWIYRTVTAGITLLVLQTYTPGVSGSGAYTFNGICDVAVDGSVDGHIGDIWTESVTENTDGNLFSGLVEHRGLVRYEAE